MPKKSNRLQASRPFPVFIWVALLLGWLSSCTGLKVLEEGQKLYTGASLKVKTDSTYKNSGRTRGKLEEVIFPAPNYELLGFARPELWFYRIAGNPKKEKGLWHWVKTRLGKPPVLAADVDEERVKNLLENRLYNSGYFVNHVSYTWKKKKKTASIEYQVDLPPPYKLRSIHYPQDSSQLAGDIHRTKLFSELDSGQTFDLSRFKQERIRIDSALKQQGYFYFNSEYLKFEVDTTVGNRQMDVFLTEKKGMPNKSQALYTLNRINVYTDYSLENNRYEAKDTTIINNRVYYAHADLFKPRVLDRYIFLDSGEIYRRQDHIFTIDKLNGLDVFRFVNVKFKEASVPSALDADIFLVPMRKKTLQLEAGASSKSNNFVGTTIQGTFTNRNFLKGAEHFSLNAKAGFETLVSGQQDGVNSYELGIDATLDIPRFLIPFADFRLNKKYVPHTDFMVGGEVLKRVRFYRLNSLNFSYGFRWNETDNKSHRLNPISFNYLQLRDTTAEFASIIQGNRLLARSFEDQFILGSNYTYTYRNDFPGYRKRLFWRGNLDLSGNLMHLLQSATRTTAATEDSPYRLFGDPYSQFVRISSDLRHYYKIGAHMTIASRLFLGAGLPVGNSAALPYVKQFFSGGSNSIRAFPARSVGPGTYSPPDSLTNGLFLDQSGDLKLEANIEWRFDIISYLKGALFVDAGNTWLVNTDPARPGAAFEAGNFYREMAVGSGLGLRLDTDFFVLRLDWGIPLREVQLAEENTADPKFQWTFSDWKDSSWRNENIILNIAIGYPF